MKSILSLFAMGTIAAAAAFAQAPKLEIVGGETYNWGKVKYPSSGHLEATIKMKNVGGGNLKLVEVKPGCGCTKTDPDKFIIPAGDVSTMGVKLNVTPSHVGSLTKSVTIRWGDSVGLEAKKAFKTEGIAIPVGLDTAEHVTYLMLQADINKALQLQPTPYFSFVDLKIGQESSTSLTLINNDSIPVTLSEWKTEGPIVANSVAKKVLAPGERMTIAVRIVPQAVGNVSGSLKFKTSHPDTPEFEVKAYGAVTPTSSPVFQQSPK